ncbi:MAG: hypothetical protein ABW127_17015 [Candidatus Thiodiazotropha endolucinida]
MKRRIEDLLMDHMEPNDACEENSLNELILTRNVLLANLFAGKRAPREVLRVARRYSTVTHWEELLCVAFNPSDSRLMAVVSIRQPDGYSGILRRHGSIEYVRFSIDWGDGDGLQAAGLSHFKVCDAIDEGIKRQFPVYHLVSCGFETARYRRAIRHGAQPRVRAVLSWNQVPDLDAEFIPVFGNQVDSQISINSDQELTSLFSIAEDLSEKAMLHLGSRQPYAQAAGIQ